MFRGIIHTYAFQHMLTSLLCLCIITIASLFNNAYAQTACTLSIQHIEAAKSTAQDSPPPVNEWVTISKLPDQWYKRWPNYNGIAWYKIGLNYQCPEQAVKQPLALAIEGITQSGRVFINHDLLWQDVIPRDAAYSSRSQHSPRIWSIPASSLKQGQNIVWIQVYGSPTQKSGIGKLEAGTYENVMSQYKSWNLEKRSLIELNTMINFVLSIFFFLAWIAVRNEKAFLWLFITGMSWVLYSISIIYTDPIPWLSNIQLDRLQQIIFYFYTVFGCIGAWYFAHHPFPRIQKSLLGIATIAALCIGFSPEVYLNQISQIFFSFFVLVFALKCLTYPYLAYKVKLPETYMLAVMYCVYLPIAIHDAHFMITMEGHAWSPYTGPLTTLALGGILALRLARHTREIQRFNKTLTENIHHAEQKLTASLGQQHQLALENARLQERVNLSHDLHDGLGGSIVRSLILIEQNDKIEKMQILSILKLLRNDLRQVIDSGSSLNIEIPATPIEWGAAIRRRFVQLFEEIDIRSVWHFEPEWTTAPTALQCMTLTRVSEEALTNILKHSQATEVSVTLFEQNQLLILQIQDNGIGFDPAAVNTGLHVGLYSMQTRIEKIGGIFEIRSQSGQTQLTVRLPLR
ncbi:sensor histidine kinase [Acinetobacter tianfuensis]|uniref:histidine kinase n=1 Tax=Acinetobacter tianfuensis TaxID=2419603 RepID=A0A3A8E6A7_9GAMM|nr:ATP-binding protein [Acinetobacter tianfuensis]RKG30602.1 histidine kinase [Acinetobacter tianfuensis]